MASVPVIEAADPLANIELEAELLGRLMMNGEGIDPVADLLSPADFLEPLHGRIFEAILFEKGRGRMPSPLTLKAHFDGDEALNQLGGMSYLARLSGMTSMLDPRQGAQHLSDLSKRRAMREGLREAVIACGDLRQPTGDIATLADRAVAERGFEAVTIAHASDCVGALVDEQGERPGARCRSIASLDDLLGPVEPSDFVVVAGRPGMGKTALALSYSLGVARSGHGVLFVSLEMSMRQLAARLAADLCFDADRIPYAAIRDGQLSEEQRRKVARHSAELGRVPFQIVDVGRLTTGGLGRLVRSTKRAFAARGSKLELVVIDYLQLLSPDAKGLSHYEAVSQISRDCKAIAKENDVGVMALAQLSRAVEQRADKRPQLSDLRDSGQIEQDADAVLFLLREEYYLRKAEPEASSTERAKWEQAMRAAHGQIEFILAKKRNGVEGVAHGRFFGAFQAVR